MYRPQKHRLFVLITIYKFWKCRTVLSETGVHKKCKLNKTDKREDLTIFWHFPPHNCMVWAYFKWIEYLKWSKSVLHQMMGMNLLQVKYAVDMLTFLAALDAASSSINAFVCLSIHYLLLYGSLGPTGHDPYGSLNTENGSHNWCFYSLESLICFTRTQVGVLMGIWRRTQRFWNLWCLSVAFLRIMSPRIFI